LFLSYSHSDEANRYSSEAQNDEQRKHVCHPTSAKGQVVAQVCRKLGITEQTYCRWRKEYGGMKVEQAKRLKLELENGRLKQLVANLTLDKEIFKEAGSQNF
tara:strand:- start:801 stop:1106 length:306 start_codon:yes stop_codon:yes gene_type:complete